MIKQMRDKSKTRVVTEAITSYAPDYDVHHGQKSSTTDTINLSIGSALVSLKYMDKASRDQDVSELDTLLNVGSNLR
jgi:hypothetical protein